MSFKEKMSWCGMIVIASVWSFYFARLGQMFSSGSLTETRAVWLLSGCIVAMLAGYLGGAAVFGRIAPNEIGVVDEREQAIALKASNTAFLFLSGILGGLSALAYTYTVKRPDLLIAEPISAVVLIAVNGVILSLAVAEVARHLTSITLLRKGS